MFESSVIHARVLEPRSRFSLLTVSLIAHSAVIIGAIAVSVASIEFPAAAPAQFGEAPAMIPVRVPPPLGDPNGGAKPQPAQPEAPKSSVRPPDALSQAAPSTVPESVTPVESTAAASNGTSGAGTGSGDGPVGVPWGTPGSVGELDGPPVTTTLPPIEEKVYHPGGEVKPAVLLRRVEPIYPPLMLKARMRATVLVRCVIDRDGRVRDPRIVSNTHAAFNEAVLSALQQWRYAPGSYRDRQVETYLDVTVNFDYK